MHLLDLLLSIKQDLLLILPEIMLALTLILLIIGGLILKNDSQKYLPWLLIILLFGVIILDINQIQKNSDKILFGGMLLLNYQSVILKILIEISGILSLLMATSNRYFKNINQHWLELTVFMVGIILGAHIMVMSTNLLMLFIALEIVSLGSYLLVSFVSSPKTAEASIKYLFMGLVASGLMLYGITFVYGFTGSLDITHTVFLDKLLLIHPAPVLMAFALIFTGVVFKISAVPFHFWVADVYESTPLPIIAFFSSVTKIAAWGMTFHIIPIFWHYDFLTDATGLHDEVILGIIAISTLLLGTFGALMQVNFRRLFAYSSIAHSGFMLMPLINNQYANTQHIIFYLCTYIVASFLLLMIIEKIEEQTNSFTLNDYNGLAKNNQLIAILSIISLIALTGLPPTGSFFAKIFIFTDVWKHFILHEHLFTLILFIVGLITTVISLFFYLRLPYHLYFKKDTKNIILKYSLLEYTIMCLLAALLIIMFTNIPLFVTT